MLDNLKNLFDDFLDTLEEPMNKLTDMDWGWWPVLFLRPEQDQDIDNLVLLKLSSVFGILLGIIIFLQIQSHSIFSNITTLVKVILSGIAGVALFFFVYKFTFAIFWNRRSRRLRGEQDEQS